MDGPPNDVNSTAWAKCIIDRGSEVLLRSSFLPNLTITGVLDGDAELLVSAQNLTPYNPTNIDSQYPAHFRIPPTTLFDLSEEECISRALQFAIGSLVYSLMVGKPPFADLDDSLVQQNFERGIYPPETMEMPAEIAISVLGFWSQEFTQQITKQIGYTGKVITRFTGSILYHARTFQLSISWYMKLTDTKATVSPPDQNHVLGKVLAHVKAQPIRSGITAFGILVFTAASLINPALGVAGFSAMGPLAGSFAAAWQSSIGLVQAGTFFAWCQSAAMGGAAAGMITGAQGLGLSAAALGIIREMRAGCTVEDAARQLVWNLFTAHVKKVVGNDRRGGIAS